MDFVGLSSLKSEKIAWQQLDTRGVWEAFDNFDADQIAIYDGVTTKNELSDRVSKDLKKRGFKFMGTVTCYSYLEAIGIMNNYATYCYKYKEGIQG